MAPESNVETYVAARLFIDNWRWGGVPFYLRTGKNLPLRASEVRVQFRPTPNVLFAKQADLQPNALTLRLQPDEGIFLRFNGKIEKEGWKLAIVMRLASAPFGLVNMFLAVTKMPLYIFFLTTMVGELPIAFIGCFVGATMQSLSEAAGAGGGIHWTTQRIVLFAIEGTVAVVFFIVAM